MIKIQLTATVSNPDTEDVFSGWVDKDRPFELRELSTDVPEYEFESADDAEEFLTDFMGPLQPHTGEPTVTTILHAENVVQHVESGEDWHYAAMVVDTDRA